MKQFVIITLLSFLCSSCRQDNYFKGRLPVDIIESTIPPTGTVNTGVAIQLKALAWVGCYSDLKVKLTKLDARHFLLTATGLYESNGICPLVVVEKDTIITFRPTATGKYFFQTNESPFAIRKDTLEIN